MLQILHTIWLFDDNFLTNQVKWFIVNIFNIIYIEKPSKKFYAAYVNILEYNICSTPPYMPPYRYNSNNNNF